MRTIRSARSCTARMLAVGILLVASGALAQPVPPEVAKNAHQWPLPNKDYESTRADFTSRIDSTNVNSLAVAWTYTFPVQGFFGAVATNPLVLDGIVYFQDLESNVFALNLHDGSLRWQVDHDEPNFGPDGVAVGYGKLFALKDPKTMAAFDLDDGSELWAVDHTRVATEGMTIQPLVYDGRLYMSTVPGTGAEDFYAGGASGMIHALDVDDGASLWSFDTVDTQPASIWGNSSVNSGGGAWYPPSVDTASGTTFWGIGNPAPFAGTPAFPNGSSRPGPNLYSNSIVALDHATGNLDWYHQAKAHDLTDADFMSTPILATTDINSVPTEIAIGSGKLGKVFAYDRATGSVLWTTSVGQHMNDTLDPLPPGDTSVLPGVLGGVETPMAYAGDRVFVPVVNLASTYNPEVSGIPFVDPNTGTGELVALNADDGSIAWSESFGAIHLGGATVVNDLVISATFDGTVWAHDRTTGTLQWSYATGVNINSSPAVSGDTLLIPTRTELIALRLPTIPDVVSQVSAANLSGHVAALATTIGQRYTATERDQAADYIETELQGFGYTVTRPTVNIPGIAETGENVVAKITGTSSPERTVVVGAHYDTVLGSPGADDDASGVAGVLEIARLLQPFTFDASVEFVFFDLAEQGFVGSLQHAIDARAADRDLDAVFVLEMIGYTCASCQTPLVFPPNICIEVSTQSQTTGLHVSNVANHRSEELRDRFIDDAATHVPALPTEWARVACSGDCAPDTRLSDNAPFWDRGYPAVMINDGGGYRNPNYHAAGDTAATLDTTFMRQTTQAVLAAVMSVADIQEIQVPSEPDLCGSWQFTSACVDPADPSEVIQASEPFDIVDTLSDGSFHAVVGSGTPTHFLNGIHEVAISLPAESTPIEVDEGSYAAPPSGVFVKRHDFTNPFALGDPSGLCDAPPLAATENELSSFGDVTEDDGFWKGTRIEASVDVGQVWLYDDTTAQCAYVADSPIVCSTVGMRSSVDLGPGTTTVEPRDGIRIEFPAFSFGGTVLVSELSEPASEVPANFQLNPAVGLFFDISTTPTAPPSTPPYTVCFDYPDANQNGFVDGAQPPLDENRVEILHEQGTIFVDVTTSRDPVANEVCGEVTSFSQFVLGKRIPGIWRFFGVAQGGSIDVTLEGVVLQVVTFAGQTADQVAQALADAINADATLAGAGVTASVSDHVVTTNGLVNTTALNDPGLSHTANIPALQPVAWILLGLLLLLAASSRLLARADSRRILVLPRRKRR